MSRAEFGSIMAYIAAGCQFPLSKEAAEVYFDLLGDLPQKALMIAAKRAVLHHVYRSFPPVALLREFGVDAMRGEVKAMTGGEAWAIATKACGSTDVDVQGSRERAFAKVPEIVKAAVDRFGFMALYNLPNNAVETARAQFVKVFDSIAERERKTDILPAAVQKEIAAMPEASRKKLGAITPKNIIGIGEVAKLPKQDDPRGPSM